MKGLLVAERYFKYFGLPMFKEKFPDYLSRAAFGLVGEGSECFGFDDEQSRDHDWGPGFCIWLNSQDYSDIGEILQKEYYRLPKSFAGIKPRTSSGQIKHKRVGVFTSYSFYERFLKLDELPETWQDWISIPEENLAVCTNGKVFHDEFGEFTYIRKKLLEYYPSDVRLKKIANYAAEAAREGQYNYLRCINRGEVVAANHAESQFLQLIIKLTFLLNWKYPPFYKWNHRALYYLPILGAKLHVMIREMIMLPKTLRIREYYDTKVEMIERVSSVVIEEMKRQQLTSVRSNYLLDHVQHILSRIENPEIRNFGSEL